MRKYFENDTQELLAREELRELRYRYCLAVDERDWNGIEACFAPDAVVDFGAAGVVLTSREVIVNFIRDTMGSAAPYSGLHLTYNTIIEFSSTTQATGRIIMQLVSKDPDTGAPTLQTHPCLDHYIKTGQGWQIQSSKMLD